MVNLLIYSIKSRMKMFEHDIKGLFSSSLSATFCLARAAFSNLSKSHLFRRSFSCLRLFADPPTVSTIRFVIRIRGQTAPASCRRILIAQFNCCQFTREHFCLANRSDYIQYSPDGWNSHQSWRRPEIFRLKS